MIQTIAKDVESIDQSQMESMNNIGSPKQLN